jgi:hypothetical protein
VRWPFSRRRPAPTGAGTTTRSEPAAWRSLPTIHRTVERIEPTAHSTEFAHDLGIRRPLEHFYEPLGHEVRTEAPSGIATGIASPAVAGIEGPELDYSHAPDRPLGHEPTGARTASGAPGPVQRSPAPSGEVGRMPEVAPVRVLRATEQPPAQMPVGETESEIVPEPSAASVARTMEAQPAPTAGEGEAAREAEVVDEPVDALQASEPQGGQEVSEEGSGVQRVAETEAPLVGRRLGLGDPLTRRPPTATEAPSIAEEGLPLAARPGSSVAQGSEGPSSAGIQRAAVAPGPGQPSAAGETPTPGTSFGPTAQPGTGPGTAPIAGATPSMVRTHRVMRKASAEEPESESVSVPETPPSPVVLAPRRLAALPPEPRAGGAEAASGETSRVHRAAEEYGPGEELPPPAGSGRAQRAREEATPTAPEPQPLAGPGPQEEAAEEIVPEPAAAGGLETEPGAESLAEESSGPEAAPVLRVAPLVSARHIARSRSAGEAPAEFVQRAPETPAQLAGVGLQRAAARSGATGPARVGLPSARTLTTVGTGPAVSGPAEEGRPFISAGELVPAPSMQHVSRTLGPEAVSSDALAWGPHGEPQAGPITQSPGAIGRTEYQPGALPLVSRKASEPAPTTMRTTRWVAPMADPGAAAVAAGVATPDGNGSVIFRTPAEVEAPSAALQRQEAEAGPSAEPAGPLAEPTVAVGGSKKEIEELASKLEEPLFRRLRQSLLLLRERSGKLADL